MPPKTDEKAIQQNSIELLKNMGYTFIPKDQMQKYRTSTNQIVLKDILLNQLQKINSFEYKGNRYNFSPKNISKAIDDLDESLSEGLMVANQKITDRLLMGNSYLEELVDGVIKSFSLFYIDFKNPQNNVFHCTEEFIVDRVIKSEKEKSRRPDLVLFINGIPFGVIELKKSSIETSQGISQMIRNQNEKEIPNLFKFIQITLAGNNHSPKYATAGTPEKFYATWKEEEDFDLTKFINTRIPSPLDETIYSLFSYKKVLKLLSSFIIFDGRIKKIARYQQYFAIKNILKRIEHIDNTGTRAGGLIWHTQGSGKSLTMVMLAKIIKKNIAGSKIVVVTDRKDLDKQIHSTFNSNEVKAYRAKSGQKLIELLLSGKSVITTLVHKFETVKKEKVVLDDPNIFILVDEAHRTQGGQMHKDMRKVFKNACYLGFTGTPLMKKEKSSFEKFGGEIHRYTIDQAVKDKAVLPLLYEGRLVEQWINDKDGLDRRFEKISKHLTDEQKLDLKKKWARFKKVASSERRLEAIMMDINEHYKEYIQGTGFKAMLATSSKYEAIKYYELFEEEGDIKTAFVISAPDSREGFSEVDESDENKEYVLKAWQKILKTYGDEDSYLDKIKDQFVNGDEIELLIVVDKLLTGFDAPRAQVLYVDKPLKDHNLLQAIARVNRLYDGKDYGFIIDYRGLLGDLDKALSDYSGLADFDEEDITGAVFDIKEEIAKLKTYYSYLEELFSSIKYKDDQESFEVYLADKEKRKLFYEYLSHFARSLKLALSSDKLENVFSEKEVEEFKKKMKFYSDLRKAIKIRYHERVDFGKYEKQMQKLLDTFISANEVNNLTKLVNIFDESFDEEIERVVGSNAKADSILSACSATITEKKESNPAYYEKLSQRIKEIIEAYQDKRLTEEQKLEAAKDIRDALLNKKEDEDSHYPQSIRKSNSLKAFYDNLDNLFDNKELLTDVVLEIDDIFKSVSKKPDWKNNNDIKNQIDGMIDDIFWKLEDEYGMKFDEIDRLLALLRSIGVNNY